MKDKLILAKQLEQKGDWSRSFEIYKEIYIQLKNPKLLFKLGFLSSKLNRHKQAINAYTEYLKYFPKDVNALHNLGIEYFHIQDYENSKNMLLESIQINSNFIRSYLLLGYIYELLGDFQNALKIFSLILKKEPNNKLAIEGIVLSLIKSEKLEKALEFCNQYLKIFPENLTLKNLKTGILLKLNKTEEFLEELKEITEKDHKFKSFEQYVEDLKNKRENDYKQFAEEIQQKLILKTKEIQEKEDSKAYLDLSLLSLFSGNKQNALEYLKKALDAKSKND